VVCYNGVDSLRGRTESPEEPGNAPPLRWATPSIHVDSIDETLEAVVERGGAVIKPRRAIVEGSDWQGIFRDPAGNAFALYEAAAQ
jgi:predicted enzyme related to lactoylglutathione lyase